MLRRCLPGILVCGLLLVVFPSRPATAGNLLGWLKGRSGAKPPAYPGNPQSIFGPRPAPHLYPEYNVYQPWYGQSVGVSPWYGYGFGVPTYPWGYFGACCRPAVICHKGYHGDLSQWGYRRGY